MQNNNLFKEMCREEGVEPSDIDPSVNTFEELFDKYNFSGRILLNCYLMHSMNLSMEIQEIAIRRW